MTATDGDIGSVADFLLDDERWTVRYLVAETGGFFDRRRVLISPIFFGKADWASQRFYLSLTRDKVKNSPSIDTDKPVSRQHERDYFGYFGYPLYWGYPGLWGISGSPAVLAGAGWNEPAPEQSGSSDDVHLRSVAEVRGYNIQGTDDGIGHVEDFIVDDETWEVRYLVIDTSNWWFGKKVLIAPRWAKAVSWEEKKVHVDVSRRVIKDSPEWDPTTPIDREYEERLYGYYRRPGYWEPEERAVTSVPHDERSSHP